MGTGVMLRTNRPHPSLPSHAREGDKAVIDHIHEESP
jgi:hypothetical protein